MATLTYAGPKRTFVRPSRNYDHLYDPNFYASSNRDHAKEILKSQTTADRIRYVPNFRTMFSVLRHYPRQRVTLDMTDPVPSHVSRQWKGFRDQARETIIRYKKSNYAPRVQVPPQQFEPAHVRGMNRFKYFRRPIIPFLPQMPPNVVLGPARIDPLEPPLSASEDGMGGRLFDTPKTRSVLVQTDYRDSEAQTDPYSPEYVVRPGSQPELLTLASLSYGRGLPAGVAEVEMIERARAKRAWEASLPHLDDLGAMGKRRRMMEEQERKEWAFREQEIEKMQEERIEVVKQIMQQREVDHHALNSKRMEHFWSKKQAEKDRYFRRLHNDHVKALRKVTKLSSNVEGKLERKSVINQYSNFDSQVYAPMTRIGVYLDSGSEQYNVKSHLTTTLDGLLELEETLPLSVLNISAKTPTRSAAKAIGMEARRRAKLGSILAQVHSEIIDNKTMDKEEEKPLRLLNKVEKVVPRPPTPTISKPEAQQEEKELALILIQRVIRGRAIQSKMFEGKERRQQLIQELRTTHALQLPEQNIQKEDAEAIRVKCSQQARQKHKESLVQDCTETAAATHLGQRLDFLNKELIRLQEEQRVAAYIMLAERQRRIREAEESGRRQREERIRRTEDEMFKQMMRVHQGTVDTYLEDVILKSMDRTADQEARKEIAAKADAINKLAHKFEHTELSGKELVAELVHSFLLPEVEKKTMREKVQMDQRKHLLAAHRIILDKVNELLPSSDDNETTDGAVASPSRSQDKPGDSIAHRIMLDDVNKTLQRIDEVVASSSKIPSYSQDQPSSDNIGEQEDTEDNKGAPEEDTPTAHHDEPVHDAEKELQDDVTERSDAKGSDSVSQD